MNDETGRKDNNIIKRIKNLKWQDLALILIITLVFLLQISLFSKLQHLPGPIYGGDLYRERGYAESIIRGNSVLSDPVFLGETNYFPWLGHAIGAFISNTLGIHIENIFIFFPAIVSALLIFGFYLIGLKIFQDKNHALLLAAFSIATNFYHSKITSGLAIVFSVFAVLFWFKAKESKKILDSVIMGCLIGLCALTHGSIFINLVVLIASIFTIEVITRIKDKTFDIKNMAKRYLPGFVVASAISMFFFLPIIIRYSLKTINNSYSYALIDINRLGFFWGFKKMFEVFFNFSSVAKAIIGLVALTGLIYLFFSKKKSNSKYVLAMFFGTILAGMHYIITKPLFNKWMEPGHMIQLLFIPASLLFVFGIHFICVQIKNKTKQSKMIVNLLAFLLIIIVFISSVNNYNNSRWVIYGRDMDNGSKGMLDFGEWIKLNTDKDDVFLAHDETSFALNAVSGAKVVMSRRVHASYFVDINKRYADSMVMLYGNNPEKTKELIEKYQVEYFYIDQQLVQSPVINELKYKDYFAENGINYSVMNVRWDPSTESAPSFISLVVPFQNLTIVNFAEPFMEVKAGELNMGLLYKIK